MKDISKEQRFKILEHEFETDIMYQPSMDTAWREGLKIPGYIKRIKEQDADKTLSSFPHNVVMPRNC